ncbi:hypothetical protein GCM10007416_34720 [Kroppenstedtia guangzhouensis]|uniref:Uncharacterized protein n=1 Tax=Kroppenstedtia guangzhouensis TaxID=1274356 RepID=A0ABQ1H4K3_9BACL|nr:hypothetical protein GCM10007416_34720 [Kroppenstedtia guangzhouensis]
MRTFGSLPDVLFLWVDRHGWGYVHIPYIGDVEGVSIVSQTGVLSEHRCIEEWCNHYRIEERYGSGNARSLLYQAIADHVNREMGREVLIKKYGQSKGA